MSYAAAADGGPMAAQRRAPNSFRNRGKRQQASGQQQSSGSSAGTTANQASNQAAASSPSSAAAAQGSQSQAQVAASSSETKTQAQSSATQQQGSGSAAASEQKPTAVESSSFSAPSWSTDPGAFISSTASESGPKGLSPTAIGALVGGIIGAIALIIVAFVIWRQCRGRGEKVAPPPPREVSYNPPTTLVGSRSRSMSMTMSNHRVSSYSTLIAPPASYRHSLYGAYPADSPTSSIQQDQSPRFISSSISGSPSLSSSGGNTTPATGPTRDGSTGSNSDSKDEMSTAFQEHDGRPLNRGPSSDLLSPYEGGVTSTDGSESRTTGSDSRTSSPPPSIAGRLPPRNTSMGSLGSGLRYPAHSHHRHRSGAPHHRSISITLPRPLSQSSVHDNAVSPSGTMTYAHRGSHYSSNRTTPRTSMYGEFGAQSAQASPSGHRRGPSTSSRTSGHRPEPADVDNLRFEGREEIV